MWAFYVAPSLHNLNLGFWETAVQLISSTTRVSLLSCPSVQGRYTKMPVHLLVFLTLNVFNRQPNQSRDPVLILSLFVRVSFRLHSLQIYALFHIHVLVVEVLSQRAPTIHSSFLVNLRTQKNVCCSEQNLWLLQIIPGLEEVLAGMRLGGSFISSSKKNMFMPSS